VSFIKRATPPPSVREGDVLKARITNVSRVTSKWKDEEGNPREQLQFDLELENGYKFRSWVAYYKQPSDRSKLGKLALKFMELTGQKYNSVGEFLEALDTYGYVYVTCTGFREFEDELYPNFSIVATRLPPLQTKIEPTKPLPAKKETSQQREVTPETLEFIQKSKEIIELGLPLNEGDWNETVPVQVRAELLKLGLVEKKENLYFFTEGVRSFL
jgi:hypothetical protein